MTPLSLRQIISANRRLLYYAIITSAVLVVVLAFAGFRLFHGNSTDAGKAAAGGAPEGAGDIRSTATPICGEPILNSPYTYDGAAGAYPSGEAGLPTYGTPGSEFPHDTAGIVLPTGVNTYLSYQLKPDTVYYMLPGVHIGSIQADTNDAFVGGRSHDRPTVLSGNYSSGNYAIDSNSSNGNQSGVTIEYLTIEKYRADANGGAINQETNTGWDIEYNTVTLNVPG